MVDYRVDAVVKSLTAMGEANTKMLDEAAGDARAHIDALPAPQLTQAPAGAANLARPAALPINTVDKPVDNPQGKG